jgi:hypothetical protein
MGNLLRASGSGEIAASPPNQVDQKGGCGETAEDQSRPAKHRKIPWLRLDSGNGQRAAGGVESCEENEAPDEQQVEAAPPASNVEEGEDCRVDDENRAE